MGKFMSESVTQELRDKHARQDDKCHTKAREKGEMTFTIREQDRSAAKVIAFWIMENIEKCPASKLFDALESAIVARDFPNKKNAD